MNQTTPALTPAEALMTVAVLAMDADDCYDSKEMERLRAMTWLHPLFMNIDSADRFIGQRFSDLRGRGRGVVFEDAARALNAGLRETAFAWAVELVYADGAVVSKEHVFLDRLARRFDIPGPLARKIRAVTAIRRRAV